MTTTKQTGDNGTIRDEMQILFTAVKLAHTEFPVCGWLCDFDTLASLARRGYLTLSVVDLGSGPYTVGHITPAGRAAFCKGSL